jgi:biopolymer transport protein ExbD
MFFLLLFFLIVSSLASPSVVKLLLPQTKTSQAITKPQISLAVTNEKKYFINNKEIPASKLEVELKKATQNNNEPLVILRFDKALTVQDLVNVLQIGSNLKIKMVLATQSLTNSK